MKRLLIALALLVLLVSISHYFNSLHKNSILEPLIVEDAQKSVVKNFNNTKAVENIPEDIEYKNISLDTIFPKNEGNKLVSDNSSLATLVTTGDYIVARSVNYKTLKYNNFKWGVEEFIPLLQSADISLINLENPLLEKCPITNEGFTFCGDVRHIEGLNSAGIDIVNLANNHSANYGLVGLEETTQHLGKSNILYTGLVDRNLIYKTVKGIKFAFLGYNDVGNYAGVPSAETKQIEKDINQANENADIVIVSFHWGVEYTTQITDRQKELAYKSIDSGADLIVGNHPHWIQPIEIYKDKLIVYAHGNFIFDQMWSEETREGVIAKYYFTKDKVVDVEFYPVYIEDYGKAVVPITQKSSDILNRLEKISRSYSSIQN